MEPYLYTFVELVCITDRSNKFYCGYLDHQTNEPFFQYGRMGASGTWNSHGAFDTFEEAHKDFMKQMKSKMVRGYWVTRSATLTCAGPVPRHRFDRYLYNLQVGESNFVIANVDNMVKS